MITEININGLEELPGAAQKFLKKIKENKVCAFYGNMGAGKTTFIKEICKKLNVKDTMSSPTYSIINEYHTQEGAPVYHMDFYRIKNEEEAQNIGAEDYFYSGNHCFIEWPSKIENLLPEKTVKVEIEVKGSEQRTLKIQV